MTTTVETDTNAKGLDKVRDLSGQLKSFYGDVRTEMKKVTVPSWTDVRSTTLVVLGTVALFGVFFFVVDLILTRVVDGIIGHFSR